MLTTANKITKQGTDRGSSVSYLAANIVGVPLFMLLTNIPMCT